MTTQPKIELKSINVHVGLSDETPAYTAKLHVDGKFFADVSNQGCGGPDSVHAPNAEVQILEARVAATFPKLDMSKYDMEDADASLEGVCHTLAWEHVDKRNLKSRLSRAIMTLEGDKIYTYKGRKSEARLDALATKKPDAVILNRLTFSEVWTVWMQHS